MQCILNAPLSSRSDKIIIVDWTRINCPTDMIYDSITNTCICFNKYYDSGSTCLGCLDYCATCGDSLTCTESDTNRDMTGNFDCLVLDGRRKLHTKMLYYLFYRTMCCSFLWWWIQLHLW